MPNMQIVTLLAINVLLLFCDAVVTETGGSISLLDDFFRLARS